MKTRIEKNNEDRNPRKQDCCARIPPKNRMPWIFGVAATLTMIGFYLGLLTLISDWYNAKAQFGEYRWWIGSLAIGFGVQVALFTRLRHAMAAAHIKGAASGMAASSGMSGVAMALCCSHYLAALLPVVGLPFLSTLVAGLDRYQTQFFFVGVVANILGMTYMLWVMSKNGLLPDLPALLQRNNKLANKQET